MTLPTPDTLADPGTPAEIAEIPVSAEAEHAAFIQAQRDAQKIIERAPTNEVPLSELQGLSLSEQFYRIWGTPERGQALWESWYRSLGAAGDTLLEAYAASTAETMSISVDEARWRLAVDKVLNDCGMQFATRFLDKYNADALRKSRPLQPMALRSRKK